MKRILVASDLSPRSQNALARAIGLAATAGAEIRIVHAATASEAENACSSTHGRMVREARIMAEELAERPLEISGCIGFHGPAKSILDEAEAWDADIIVLGAHGEPRFRDAVFGTTGTHVVRHSDRPVLVVQNVASEPYTKVLIAVDDAGFARPILDVVLAVAPASELFAVHAFYPSLSQTLEGRDALDQEEKRQEAELESLMAEAAAGRPASRLTANKHAVVETGEALSVIMRETEEIVPDLVAMGTRRRATYLSSHAVDSLFWCPHDVLVVPERDSAEVNS
jgi:nucleotide-binding universal stress UspA family protein